MQGGQEFVRERGRAAAMKRAEGQRMVNGGETASPPAPSQRRYAGGQGRRTPVQAVRRPPSPGEPDTRPVRDGGRTIIKTARSGRKTTERTARQTIKTADRSSRKAIKTTQRTAKTAQQTVKTAQRSAQATVKATQRAVQTARATAKAAAATAKATAKATVAAIKAAIAAMQELIAAIAAGGWVVLVVVLVICMIGLLIASPFGIFFSDGGGSPDAASPTAVIAQINSEYADRLSALQTGGTYDRVEIQGGPPSWPDVFAVFAAKTAGGADGAQVSVLDTDTVEKLRTVFWDMTKITTAESEVEHPAEGDTAAWTEKVLTITVTPRTPDDMRVFYAFTDQQNAALDELLTAATRDTWQEGFLNIFRAVQANKPFVMNVYRSVSRERVEQYLKPLIHNLVLGVIEEKSAEMAVSEADKSFIAYFYEYAFIGIMLDWISENMKGDPEIIVERTSKLIHGSIIRALNAFRTDGSLQFAPND